MPAAPPAALPTASPTASPTDLAAAARAAHAPAAPRQLDARLAGFHTVTMDDSTWRLFVLRDARDHQWIVVGERQDVRGELVGKITLRSVLPDLVGLPLVGLLVWLAIGWGLRPLRRLWWWRALWRLHCSSPTKSSRSMWGRAMRFW